MGDARRRWTEAEEHYLLGHTDAEASAYLRRSLSACAGKRHNLIGGQQLVRWSSSDDALLGSDIDSVIAKRIGRTTSAVRHRRERLKIPRVDAVRSDLWSEDELALLGTDTDQRVSEQTRRTLTAVKQQRDKLKIPAVPRRSRRKPNKDQQLIDELRAEVARLKAIIEKGN